jgi:hypothetical protein
MVDFRLARQFAFTERIKLALMGETFNLFNHTNVSTVNTTAFNYIAAGAASGGFSCVGHSNGCFAPNPAYLATTNTSNLLWGPRQLQISARLTF